MHTQKLSQSRNALQKARYYLESGESLNWVADELDHVKTGAVEAWLQATKQNTSDCITANDYLALFYQTAPEVLANNFRKLTLGWTDLEYELLGDPDNAVERLPATEWKKVAWTHVEQADRLIALFVQEISSLRS